MGYQPNRPLSLTQRTVKTGTSIYQPRPTSATPYVRPAAFNNSTDRQLHSSYRHHPSSWRPNTTATDFTHTFVIPTINRHFCCICYLAFVPFVVFGCHYSHALNLNQLRGRHAYRLRNKCLFYIGCVVFRFLLLYGSVSIECFCCSIFTGVAIRRTK